MLLGTPICCTERQSTHPTLPASWLLPANGMHPRSLSCGPWGLSPFLGVPGSFLPPNAAPSFTVSRTIVVTGGTTQMGPVFRNALVDEQCPERAGWSQAGFEGQTVALHLCWAFQEGLGAWAPSRASWPRSSTLPARPSLGDSALLTWLLLGL